MLLLVIALFGCEEEPAPGGDGDALPWTLWECACVADFLAYYGAYEDYEVDFIDDHVCGTDRAVDDEVDQSDELCVETIESYGYEQVGCECTCEPIGSCELDERLRF